MFTIERSAEFPYSSDQLFALMADIRNELKWMPTVKEVRKTDDRPLGVGSEFDALYQGFGRMHIRLTEYTPGEAFACDVAGTPVDLKCRFAYVKVPGGTRMDARIDVFPHGPLRLAQPILKWMFNKEFSKRPAQLRRGLEILYPK